MFPLSSRNRATLLAAVLCVVGANPLLAGETVFFDLHDGTFALQAADRGLVEPAVPIKHNGVLIGGHNHQVVEALDNVPGTSSFPLTFVDLAANWFLRVTYQKVDGTTGGFGHVSGRFAFLQNRGWLAVYPHSHPGGSNHGYSRSLSE